MQEELETLKTMLPNIRCELSIDKNVIYCYSSLIPNTCISKTGFGYFVNIGRELPGSPVSSEKTIHDVVYYLRNYIVLKIEDMKEIFSLKSTTRGWIENQAIKSDIQHLPTSETEANRITKCYKGFAFWDESEADCCGYYDTLEEAVWARDRYYNELG